MRLRWRERERTLASFTAAEDGGQAEARRPPRARREGGREASRRDGSLALLSPPLSSPLEGDGRRSRTRSSWMVCRLGRRVHIFTNTSAFSLSWLFLEDLIGIRQHANAPDYRSSASLEHPCNSSESFLEAMCKLRLRVNADNSCVGYPDPA